MSENVIPFQTTAAKAQEPCKRRTIGPADVECIGFISKADDGDYWIDDPGDIAKLFSFLKVNKIKINVGDPDCTE